MKKLPLIWVWESEITTNLKGRPEPHQQSSGHGSPQQGLLQTLSSPWLSQPSGGNKILGKSFPLSCNKEARYANITNKGTPELP